MGRVCRQTPLTILRSHTIDAHCFLSNDQDNFLGNWLSNWGVISKTRKPVVAAVNGYALGGGCEVAMMCDIIYAGENARFGQPEITIGTIPGGGGTQRLIREVGKGRAMEMILTGEQIDAAEALRLGLVTKVFPPSETVEAAMQTAAKMASFSLPHLMMAKEAVNQAYEVNLQQGLQVLACHTYPLPADFTPQTHFFTQAHEPLPCY